MLKLGIDPEIKCIEPPSYVSTAYVAAMWPSFFFDSFVKIWATWEIFLGKRFTAHLPPPPGETFPVRLWSQLFQGFHHSANYSICIYIDTSDNHQILSRSHPARAFYCKRAHHCIVGNNNAATHNKLYTCHKSLRGRRRHKGRARSERMWFAIDT